MLINEYPDTKVCSKCGQTKPLEAYGYHPKGRYERQACCNECYRLARQRSTPLAKRHQEQKQLRTEGLSRCTQCKQVKPLSDFYRNKALSTGYSGQCKVCDKANNLERQRRDPEAYGKRHKAWRDANPEKWGAIARKAASGRRARIREAFVEAVDPYVVYDRDDGQCGLCGKRVPRDRFDVDHITPLALGGEHSYDNVRLAHVACNRGRGRVIGLESTALQAQS